MDRVKFAANIEFTVANPFQKDVMAYASAVVGMVDTLRRIKSCRPDLDAHIDDAIARFFSEEIHAFIKDLRNNLAHGSVVVPGWSITFDSSGNKGLMQFSTQELLMLGKWTAKSKAFLQSNEHIHVGAVIREHFRSVSRFSAEVKDIFARNVTSAERDYFDLQDERARWAKGQMAKIMVSQIGKGKNPYDFLHRFFSPEEVRFILRLPKHSKEQVDAIINLKSAETNCDDQLRKYLYELFAVNTSSN